MTDLTEQLLAFRAAPGRFDVLGGHIVVAVEGCTCDGPFETYGHRPGCGYEPVMTVAEFRTLSNEDLGRLLRTAGLAPVQSRGVHNHIAGTTHGSVLQVGHVGGR